MDIQEYLNKNSFRTEDFAGLDDKDFLQAAYAAILRREPDQTGYAHYLDQLRQKRMTRNRVLGTLRYSSEGRRHKTHVQGLFWLFVQDTALALPVMGRIMYLPVRLRHSVRIRFLRLRDSLVYRIAGELASRQGKGLQGPGIEDYPQEVYLALEKEFRSSAQELETGFREYLPLVREVLNLNGDIADLGCGRGEWLDFLRRHGIRAVGVDISPVMVDSCSEQELEVILADALSYLSAKEDNSLGAVTAFHLAEHLPPPVLVRLWQECFRVLKPGGLALFETPNPENFQVSSYYFYLDPTHNRPIPPPLATYTMDALGFINIRIIRRREFDRPIFEDPRLNKMFCAAMDYAVVAWKPE